MEEETLRALDRILDTGNAAGGLDFLISQSWDSGNPRLHFEARLMKKRLELKLPLIQEEDPSAFPIEARAAYDQAVIESAREAGELALRQGNIRLAWPYFRAIGEPSKIAAAIEASSGEEDLDAIIEIALQEGVHPAKGLELILTHHGICRAISCFGMYPVRNGRLDCIALLLRNLHNEVVDRIGYAIESQEGRRPDTRSLPELLAGREWLFGEYDYYVDTSHLLSLLPYCLEVTDREILGLFHDLCEYGKHLSPMFQSRGAPPFEEPFVDYDHYVQALLGVNVDARVEHFRCKVAKTDPEEVGSAPAELLINLLVQLQRYDDAIEVSLNQLSNHSREQSCPSVLRLCHLAKNYGQMREVARGRGDMLSYLAATVMARNCLGPSEEA